MHTDDREAFTRHLGVLCQGYDLPLKPDRVEAYWRAFRSMDLGAFESLVDHCLGPDGPTALPKPGELWGIHRAMARDRRPELPSGPVATSTVDAFDGRANRTLLHWLTSKGAATAESLDRMVASKRAVTDAYRIMAQDEDPDTDEFRGDFVNALEGAWAKVYVAAEGRQ
jgi:hypothetical protein